MNKENYYQWNVELIEVIRDLEFRRWNIIKYVYRAGKKSKETELKDLQKAMDYLQDRINILAQSPNE